MKTSRIVITDCGFPNADQEKAIAAAAGIELQILENASDAELRSALAEADAVINQYVKIGSELIGAMERCKVIVRYGIGYDNIDVAAAKAAGIPVCNVPDYGVAEVAEHALALGLSLARQLPQSDARVRAGGWNAVTPKPLVAFSEMTLATAGFGRIARSLHEKAAGLGFARAAYDPFVPDAVFAEAGVERLSLDDLFARADLLSLHLPLNEETQHLLDATRLRGMKSTAIVVNTARGGLIDTRALASALEAGEIGGAGIDVFEVEPMESDHPLRSAPNTILTSHNAWYSEGSKRRLQQYAAEEAVRGVRGEPLRCPV